MKSIYSQRTVFERETNPYDIVRNQIDEFFAQNPRYDPKNRYRFLIMIEDPREFRDENLAVRLTIYTWPAVNWVDITWKLLVCGGLIAWLLVHSH